MRWCRSECRLDQCLDCSVRGVDQSLFRRVRGVDWSLFMDRSLFRRVHGVDRSLFRQLRGLDRSLDISNVWLRRLRRAWIVVRRCGSFRLARCVGRSSEALRDAVRV